VLTLVSRARRRLLLNELFAQGAVAASAALLAFILLLLLGTQVLNWRWLISIPVLAAAFGACRVRRRLPSPYATAQIVDTRLRLADTISTALYFSLHSPPKGSEKVCRLQYEAAERLSRAIDPRLAVPFTLPRAAYATAALVLVASSLFALRYGLNRRLDLKPPLARMIQQTFGKNERKEVAENVRKKLPPELQPNAESGNDDGMQEGQRAGDQPEDPANAPDDIGEVSTAAAGTKKSASGESMKQDEGDRAEADAGDGEGEERQANDGDNSGNGQQGANKGDQKRDSGSKQDANNSTDNSSLLSKVKDAWQNLLSRMKPQQGQTGSQQSSMDQKGTQAKGQSPGKQSSKEGQQQNGGQAGDAEDSQGAEQAQNAQDPQGKGTGKSDSAQTSKQPGSGIGSQDGDKNIRQAEQLAAMGKISEILGKRSATVTGESTVEVQSTSQQLHTPYAQRGVQHSQGGAEINRDEVPVALQSYVESYFEQVRKQPQPHKK
jgi:hypothetical protein